MLTIQQYDTKDPPIFIALNRIMALHMTFCKIVALISWIIIAPLFLWSPSYKKQVVFQGQNITINRDPQYNIPTIDAPSREAAYYGLGYVMAQDRLFQMHLKRVFARGQLSRLLGSKALYIDKFLRTVGLQRLAQKLDQKMKAQDPETYRVYQAFSQGINAKIKDMTVLPMEFYLVWADFKPWTPIDSLAVTKLLEFSQSLNHNFEFMRSFMLKNMTKDIVDQVLPYKPEHFFTRGSQVIVNDEQLRASGQYSTNHTEYEPFTPQAIQKLLEHGMPAFADILQIGRGSNSWVVSGKHTASGRPLLANDPHLDSQMPSQWYQVGMNYIKPNGNLATYQGSMIAGCFAGMIGQAGYIGWAITTQYGDGQDLYYEKVQGDKYFYEGKWHQLKTVTEQIPVRFGGSIKYEIKSTHRGPLLDQVIFPPRSYTVNETVSFAWVGINTDTDFFKMGYSIIQLQTYTDMKELMKSKALDGAPVVNVLYITKDDHIGYQSLGRIPIRRNPDSGAYIKDGTTSENDWLGYIRGRDRLHIEDPPKGYIVTANNRPSTQNFKSGIYGVNNYIVTARHLRLDQLITKQIASGQKFTVEDFERLQSDTVDSYCEILLPKLFEANTDMKTQLGNWNCDFTPQSYQATLYYYFLNDLEKKLKPWPELPLQGNLVYANLVYRFLNQTANPLQRALQTRDSWQRTKFELEQHFKNPDFKTWEWGKFHVDIIPHRIFSKFPILKDVFERSFPGFGNENTVNVGRMGKNIDNDFSTYHRANTRIIQSFVEGESEWLVDTGASESIFSRHYDNQLQLFRNNKYIKMFSKQPQPKRTLEPLKEQEL